MGEIERYDPNWMTVDEKTCTLIKYRGPRHGRRTALYLPDSIEYIEPGAFYQCNGLRFIWLPRSVRRLDYGVLDLPALESVTIDENNQTYALIDDVLFYKDMSYLLRYSSRKCDEVYVVPGTVKTIGRNAFFGNHHLKEVIISDGVSRIEERAFENCSKLAVVTIPPSVTNMGYYVFMGCRGASNKNWNHTGLTINDSVKKIISTINFYAMMEGVLIRGKKGSTAHQYAEEHGSYRKAHGRDLPARICNSH